MLPTIKCGGLCHLVWRTWVWVWTTSRGISVSSVYCTPTGTSIIRWRRGELTALGMLNYYSCDDRSIGEHANWCNKCRLQCFQTKSDESILKLVGQGIFDVIQLREKLGAVEDYRSPHPIEEIHGCLKMTGGRGPTGTTPMMRHVKCEMNKTEKEIWIAQWLQQQFLEIIYQSRLAMQKMEASA